MIINNIINFIYIVSKNEFALERLITQKDTIYFIYFLKNKSKISINKFSKIWKQLNQVRWNAYSSLLVINILCFSVTSHNAIELTTRYRPVPGHIKVICS